ncbi:DUF4328 domain-containing protein [Streptomyces sp. NPDC059917]|uniref:DUF4328 domain-containing protein n=1 Tax=Streptomyces sp. NPDC059917 TaxID=3347002 RepID=UPI0036519F5F
MSYDAISPSVPASAALRSPQGLATALTILLAVAGAVDLAAAAIGFGTDAAADFAGDGPLTGAALMYATVGIAQLVLLLGTGVVFIVWFHRTRVNGGVFRPDLFVQGPGWAIGSWFIPIVNLFLPFRIAQDVWRASVQAAPDGSARAVSVTPVTIWWVTFIGSNLIARASDSVGSLLSAVSAVFAVLFVRRLTAMQHAKAVQGPNAAF